MNPVMIRIMAVVGIIIGFVFMGLLYGYNEQLYASLSNHCEINSERVRTLRLPSNTAINFNLAEGTGNGAGGAGTTICKVADDVSFTPNELGISGTATSVTFETPNGTDIDISGFTAQATLGSDITDFDDQTVSGNWEDQIGLGGQFRTLTFLLIAVIPLALVAAVIAQAVPLIMSGGSSNVTDIVNKQTMGLLIAAAVIIAAPILFEQASNAQNDLVGLGSAAQFLTITDLIFDLVPLVYTIGVMGLIIYGSGLVQRFGGKAKMGGMMGM